MNMVLKTRKGSNSTGVHPWTCWVRRPEGAEQPALACGPAAEPVLTLDPKETMMHLTSLLQMDIYIVSNVCYYRQCSK